MAAGDITSLAIAANGAQVTFEVEGLTAAGVTGFEAGAAAGLKCTSSGYTGTTLGAKSRTAGIDTAFRSAVDDGSGNAIITLQLAEPIHTPETGVTMTMTAGAFSDGSVSSAALSTAAVSNASNAADYAIAVCNIVSLTLDERKTAPFYVDVYACAGSYNGHRGELGIAAVEVTITDAAATGKTITATAMEMVDRIGEYGYREQVALFRIGPFDPADWDGAGTDAAAGLATIVAKAYPMIGDAGSVRTSRTEYCYLDPADAYNVQEAWVDSVSGNDTTGAVGSASTPFATIHKAIRACQDAQGSRASWSTVRLKAGNHLLGTYAFGVHSDTSDGPVIITRDAAATRATAIITGSATSDGVRTVAVMLDDISVTASATPLSTGAPAAGSGALAAIGNLLMCRNLRLTGPGRTSTALTSWTTGFERVYWAGCYWSDAFTGPTNNIMLVRDCKSDDIAGDFTNPASNNGYINNDAALDATGTLAHSDIIQFGDGGTYENIGFHQNRARGGGAFQCAPFGNFATSGGLTSFAMTFNIQEESSGPEISQLDDPVMDSIFFYHNDWADSFVYREDRAAFAATNMFVHRNYFAGLSLTGSPSTAGIAHDNNHNAVGTVLDGVEWTTGGDTDTQFADWDNRDYAPAGDGDLVDRWSDPYASFDAHGNAMPTDGSGALGAVQVDTEGVTPVAPLGGGFRGRNRSRRGL